MRMRKFPRAAFSPGLLQVSEKPCCCSHRQGPCEQLMRVSTQQPRSKLIHTHQGLIHICEGLLWTRVLHEALVHLAPFSGCVH